MDKKVMVIGAGKHAKGNIYPCLCALGAEVQAVCTTTADHSQAVMQQFGLAGRAYSDVDTMLAQETCDKVVMVLPGERTADIVCKCLAAGKQVFTEKPCGMSGEETQRIQEALKNGGNLTVGYMKRFAPVYTTLLEEGKRLGPLCGFEARFNVSAAGFCTTHRDFVYYVAVHYLDLIRFLFGEVACMKVLCKEDADGVSYAAVLKMENGAVGTLTLENRSAWTREEESITVTYRDGFIRTEGLNRVTLHNSCPAPVFTHLAEEDRVFSVSDFPGSGTLRDLHLRGFMGEMHAFLDGTTPPDDFARTNDLCELFLSQVE